jgi:hypothetical protein
MFNRSKTWATVLLLAVFLAGGAAGWATARWRANLDRPRRGPEGMAAYLARQLDLSATQRDSIRAILERHHPDMEGIWSTVRPRLDSLRAVIDQEIGRQLSADQRQRYAQLVAELQHRNRGGDSAAAKPQQGGHP